MYSPNRSATAEDPAVRPDSVREGELAGGRVHATGAGVQPRAAQSVSLGARKPSMRKSHGEDDEEPIHGPGVERESASALLAERLEALVRERKAYDRARRRALTRLGKGLDLRWTAPHSRDELHER